MSQSKPISQGGQDDILTRDCWKLQNQSRNPLIIIQKKQPRVTTTMSRVGSAARTCGYLFQRTRFSILSWLRARTTREELGNELRSPLQTRYHHGIAAMQFLLSRQSDQSGTKRATKPPTTLSSTIPRRTTISCSSQGCLLKPHILNIMSGKPIPIQPLSRP